MKVSKGLLALPVVLGAIVASSSVSHAQTSATSIVTMTTATYTAITATSTLAIAPVAADYKANTVSAPAGILLTVTTNNTNGAGVTVAGAPAATLGLKNADLLLSSATAGSNYTTPTDVTTIGNAKFWNTATVPNSGSELTGGTTTVTVDVKVKNLNTYAVGAYINTLTWTATPNS